MENIKAAIFDLDGTLIDSMSVWEKVDVDWFARHGLAYTPDASQAFKTMSFAAAADFVIHEYNLGLTPQQIMDEWNDMVLYEYAHNIRLKDGALDLLKRLKNRGVKLGVATSCFPQAAHLVLENNGVANLFGATLFTDELATSKSQPRIYEACAAALGVSPKDCVVFEDVYHAVCGAKAAGAKVVAVYDPISSVDWADICRAADQTISSFYDLLYQVSFAGRLAGLPGAKQIRQDVFVCEQGYTMEFDETDQSCVHVYVSDGETPVATARAFVTEGQTYTVGRVAVAKPYRKKGVGRFLLQKLEAHLLSLGAKKLTLHAQISAVGFYENLGFVSTGEESFDEGQPHMRMEKLL